MNTTETGTWPDSHVIEDGKDNTEQHLTHSKNHRHFHLEGVGEHKFVLSHLPDLRRYRQSHLPLPPRHTHNRAVMASAVIQAPNRPAGYVSVEALFCVAQNVGYVCGCHKYLSQWKNRSTHSQVETVCLCRGQAGTCDPPSLSVLPWSPPTGAIPLIHSPGQVQKGRVVVLPWHLVGMCSYGPHPHQAPLHYDSCIGIYPGQISYVCVCGGGGGGMCCTHLHVCARWPLTGHSHSDMGRQDSRRSQRG